MGHGQPRALGSVVDSVDDHRSGGSRGATAPSCHDQLPLSESSSKSSGSFRWRELRRQSWWHELFSLVHTNCVSSWYGLLQRHPRELRRGSRGHHEYPQGPTMQRRKNGRTHYRGGSWLPVHSRPPAASRPKAGLCESPCAVPSHCAWRLRGKLGRSAHSAPGCRWPRGRRSV